MRSLLVSIMLLCLCSVGYAENYVKFQAPKDFRGLAWGVTLDEAPDLVKVDGLEYKNTYHRLNENLRMNEAVLTSIAYYFHKEKFYRVGIAFEGEANLFFIREQLAQKYGMGKRRGNKYGWIWSNFSIVVSYDRKSDLGTLFYTFEEKL